MRTERLFAGTGAPRQSPTHRDTETCCNDSASERLLGRKKAANAHRRHAHSPHSSWEPSCDPRVQYSTVRSIALKGCFVRRRRPTSCGRALSFATTRRSPSSCAEGLVEGVATLRLRSFDVFDAIQKIPGAQAFERAHPAHPFHAPTVCSALVARVPQSAGHGRISSVSVVLQGHLSLL